MLDGDYFDVEGQVSSVAELTASSVAPINLAQKPFLTPPPQWCGLELSITPRAIMPLPLSSHSEEFVTVINCLGSCLIRVHNVNY